MALKTKITTSYFKIKKCSLISQALKQIFTRQQNMALLKLNWSCYKVSQRVVTNSIKCYTCERCLKIWKVSYGKMSQVL